MKLPKPQLYFTKPTLYTQKVLEKIMNALLEKHGLEKCRMKMDHIKEHQPRGRAKAHKEDTTKTTMPGNDNAWINSYSASHGN